MNLADEGTRQRSGAWLAVCRAMAEVAPWWHEGDGNGEQKMVRAIRYPAKRAGVKRKPSRRALENA